MDKAHAGFHENYLGDKPANEAAASTVLTERLLKDIKSILAQILTHEILRQWQNEWEIS